MPPAPIRGTRPEQADVLQTIIDFLPSGVTLFDPDLQMIACNEQFKRLLDFPAAMFENGLPSMQELAIFNARRGDYGPGEPEALAQQVLERARGMREHVYERTRPNGMVLEIRGSPLPEGRGFVTIYTDITEREQSRRYEEFRSRTLELLAGGEPLPAILDAIAVGIERLNPAVQCAILLKDADDKRLRIGAAPSLPDFYRTAIDGMEIGVGRGSCGAAAFAGERVVVDDIATHPDCVHCRQLAARAGLGACWAQPIASSAGQVFGALVIYHRAVRAPAGNELHLIEQCARLASIAIERSLAAKKIRESEALYRLLTEDVQDVVWKTDPDLHFTYISPADERLRGFRADEVIGRHVFEMFTEEGIATVREVMRERQETDQRGARSVAKTFEAQHRCKDGRLLWGEVFSTVDRDAHGTITGYHGITREITKRKQMEEQVRQLAFYDALTELPNRRLFYDRLSQALAASRRSDCHGALMFIDLDNFKPLNDTRGHVVGDLLLIEAADRLKHCVRATDTVARLGGDEFVVMLTELSADQAEAAAKAGQVAEKIRSLLAEPYRLAAGRDQEGDSMIEHQCSASIGVVLFVNYEGGQDEILTRADAAMYEAKEAGRNSIRFHEP